MRALPVSQSPSSPPPRCSNSNSPTPAATPSKELYFHDGNIVLIAESTAFKVHKCQLARQSEMFRDLFSFVPVDPDGSLFDDVPWVELHDTSEDMMHLLLAIYDGFYPSSSATSFCALSSVMRLSCKYIIPRLQAMCIKRLIADWPVTLEQWHRRENEATDQKGRYNPREFIAHPFSVVQLVLELGFDAFNLSFVSSSGTVSFYSIEEEAPDLIGNFGPRILCSALYDISRYGPSRIFASISTSPNLYTRQIMVSPALPENHSVVRSVILQKTLEGREAAQKYLASFLQKELGSRAPSVNCAYQVVSLTCSKQVGPHGFSSFTPDACRESYYFILLNLLRSIGGIASGRDADPLFSLGQTIGMMDRRDFSRAVGHEVKKSGLKICLECKAELKKCVEKAMEDVWDLMPKWFGLADM